MTVLRRNTTAISNYFDRITRGVGHRGSSFTDVDSLVITHDKDRGVALVQEFKHETEELSVGQRLALEWLATRPGFAVWLLVKRKDGRIGFTDMRSFRMDGQRILTEAQYRARFAEWWERSPVRVESTVHTPPPPPPVLPLLAPGARQHGRCAHCGTGLPLWPRQSLADGTALCRACWRRHNRLLDLTEVAG